MNIRVLAVTINPDRPTTESFIGLHRSGIDITVICNIQFPYYQKLIDAGIPTLDINLTKNITFKTVLALRKEMAIGEYDIAHTYNNSGLTSALIASFGLPIKIVAYRGIVGNVNYFDPISWMRFLNPRIDRIICVCDAIRDYFLNMKPRFLRMPRNRPVTIYKGHKLDWYQESPKDLAEFGVPDNSFVVGCVANSRPRKGIEYLVEAIALLPKDINVCLLLVGHMKGYKLDKAINNSLEKHRIYLPGFCDNAPTISASCDVFCLPSVKREGLPRAVIEAMAYGVPAIVTDSGGSPELVQNGKSGIVIPVRNAKAIADSIEKLYRDPEFKKSLGMNAKKRIDVHFDNDETVKQTINVYRDLLSV